MESKKLQVKKIISYKSMSLFYVSSAYWILL